MEKYLYFCNILEQMLTENNIFNELNLLDVKRGGHNADANYIINFMATNYFDGGIQPLKGFKFTDINEFLKFYFSAISTYSNFTESEFESLKKKVKYYVTVEVSAENYSKQSYLLEIANTILFAKYGLNLFNIKNV